MPPKQQRRPVRAVQSVLAVEDVLSVASQGLHAGIPIRLSVFVTAFEPGEDAGTFW